MVLVLGDATAIVNPRFRDFCGVWGRATAMALKNEDWKGAVRDLERLGSHRSKLEDSRLIRALKPLDSER